jgi:uncharacterized protein
MNEANKDGNTLLHFAARSGNVELIKKLIESGEDVNAENNKGETPLQIADKYAMHEAYVELTRHGAKTNSEGST